MFVPFAGKYALAADRFKAAANAADAGEKIDKAKSIVGMMRGRRGQHLPQLRCFFISQQTRLTLAVLPASERFARPFILAELAQTGRHGFPIVYRQHLFQ